MTRNEAMAAVACAYLMLVAGCVWRFGYYGLIGGGIVALVALTFANIGEKEDDDA